MPVPKDKEALYGKIAGHMQNLGKSLTEAKDIADKAVMSKPKVPSKDAGSASRKPPVDKKCKICGKQHTGEWHQ